MRTLRFVLAMLMAPGARAQPADCPTLPATGPSVQVGVAIGGAPGVPSGTTGRAYVPVPMQAPRTDCGEPSVPADVLHGPPGDVLGGPRPDSAKQ